MLGTNLLTTDLTGSPGANHLAAFDVNGKIVDGGTRSSSMPIDVLMYHRYTGYATGLGTGDIDLQGGFNYVDLSSVSQMRIICTTGNASDNSNPAPYVKAMYNPGSGWIDLSTAQCLTANANTTNMDPQGTYGWVGLAVATDNTLIKVELHRSSGTQDGVASVHFQFK